MSEDKSHELELMAHGKPLYIIKVDVGKLPREKAAKHMNNMAKKLNQWINDGGGVAVPNNWDVIPVLVDVPEIVRRLEALEEEVKILRANET